MAVRGRTVSGGDVEFYDSATGTVLLKLDVQSAAVADLTDNSGGTADGTLQDIGVTPSEAEVANNFAECAAKINAILAVLRTYKILAE